jgi:hypothetical protein
VKAESLVPRLDARSRAAWLSCAALVGGAVWVVGCGPLSSTSDTAPVPAASVATPMLSTEKPNPDPRVGLRAGTVGPVTGTTRMITANPAAEASWNMRLIANVPTPMPFSGQTNSDLAFKGNMVFQGNYDGFMIWDVTTPTRPTLVHGYHCPASQSDVSVFQNLIFVSGEGQGGRLDCGAQGVPDSVSHERLRGIRIFDMTDVRNPRYLTNVQTCRGSHTHSVARQPNDPNNVYIYVSGSSAVRSPSELAGCSGLQPDEDPNSSLFRIEIIQVPLANPQAARVVTAPRVFSEMTQAPRRDPATEARVNPPAPGRGGAGGGGGGGGGRGGGGAAPVRTGPAPGPNQCHDITTYPEAGYAGGACQGYGILLDIRDVDQPRRLFAAADTNFATWHSVTFSNDGTKVLFTDEWGGGGAPRCRATDPMVWGGNALFEIVANRLEFRSYYKIPAAQTELENCVAHNGSLIPVPGRDIKVQGWYQGGVSIFDWTDIRNPVEIAFFDRGPLDETRMRSAGSWSIYWYNGYMYSSEINRGLDVFELTPSGFLTQNEIDAAKTIQLSYFNAQEQQRFVWPATFVLSRAYLDQLQRSGGLSATRLAAVRNELARAEILSGGQQRDALTRLATSLNTDAQGSSDAAKVRLLATSVRDLAAVQR